MAIIWSGFSGGLPQLGVVDLHDHTLAHIVQGHPEMAPLVAEIQQTVMSPTAIYASNKPGDSSSLLYFNSAVVNPYDAQDVLAVVVKTSRTPSIITTACYRYVNYGGRRLW